MSIMRVVTIKALVAGTTTASFSEVSLTKPRLMETNVL